MTLVEVFMSDGTDTSISLQPRLVSWSLNTISGLVCKQISLSLCLHILKDLKFFIFSDSLRLVFILPLRYVMLTSPPVDNMQLPY